LRESFKIARWFGRNITCSNKSIVLKSPIFILSATPRLFVFFKKISGNVS